MGNLRKDFDMEVGKKLRQLRKEKGYTQDQLAEKLETNAQYISQLERGERGLGYDMLNRYCGFFGVTKEQIGASDGENELDPTVRMLVDTISDWSESDILRLIADIKDGKFKLRKADE